MPKQKDAEAKTYTKLICLQPTDKEVEIRALWSTTRSAFKDDLLIPIANPVDLHRVQTFKDKIITFLVCGFRNM